MKTITDHSNFCISVNPSNISKVLDILAKFDCHWNSCQLANEWIPGQRIKVKSICVFAKRVSYSATKSTFNRRGVTDITADAFIKEFCTDKHESCEMSIAEIEAQLGIKNLKIVKG